MRKGCIEKVEQFYEAKTIAFFVMPFSMKDKKTWNEWDEWMKQLFCSDELLQNYAIKVLWQTLEKNQQAWSRQSIAKTFVPLASR